MSLREAHRVQDRSWVTQCALSRICGGCAMTLGRPVVFVGTPDEVARNAFHLPPMHAACAEELCDAPDADPSWQRVATSGFEFVRPGRDDLDQQPRFEPNSLIGG
ncbi:hypothetical protein GCM10009623_27430 [Nocardioides aestuarii]|uniref:Uncharacterized protein n=1 Tax=Nocardioides aestuarii TaxID=252231 RepID=A0ABW4TQ89_9ACTN